jgi:hypothetical protein
VTACRLRASRPAGDASVGSIDATSPDRVVAIRALEGWLQRLFVVGEAGEGATLGVGLMLEELAGAAPVVAGGLSGGRAMGLLSMANNPTTTIPEAMPSAKATWCHCGVV